MSILVSQEIKEFISKNLNEQFFNNNELGQLSAYRILDVTTSVDGLNEEIYKQLPEDKKREMEQQNKNVEAEEDINRLYNMLRKGNFPSTVFIIANKLMKQREQIIPRMLEDLKKSGNDNFIESAARILIKQENNYSNEIADILPEIKYPYAQSVACYVLGKIGGEEYIETVYNYFNKFKMNYSTEKFYEGPLMGLYEFRRRFGF